jgi:hypothetical protein
MKYEMNFRSFNDNDYKMVCEWWEWWWKGEPGQPEHLLPGKENRLILEYDGTPLYAGFLFVCRDAPMAYLTWIVSNPFFKTDNRKELLEEFILRVEMKAKEQGVKFMMTVCSNNTLIKAHQNTQWWVDTKMPSWEGFKYVK